MRNKEDDDDEGGSFLPGFGAAAVMGAVGIAFILYWRKEKQLRNGLKYHSMIKERIL